MMNFKEVFALLEDAVENDGILNCWCEKELKTRPQIMVGYDAVKPPGKQSYPLIILFDLLPDEEKATMTSVTRHIAISCGIYNETVTKAGRKTRFEGLLQAESFREQISQAILRKFLGKITIKPLGTEEIYPFFSSGMSVSIKSTYKILMNGG